MNFSLFNLTVAALAVALVVLLLMAYWSRWVVLQIRTSLTATQSITVEMTKAQAERDKAIEERESWASAYRLLLVEYQRHRLPTPPILPTTLSPAPTAAPRNNRLVAVFPAVGLDFQSEVENLRNLGGTWDLIVLQDELATREVINRELLQGNGCRILYLASHGSGGVVFLSEGEVVSRRWLGNLVRHYGIEVVILNACTTDELSIAVESAGAKAVVTTSDQIPHGQAIRFAAALLQAVARGSVLDRAVAYAKLNIEDGTGDIIRLRGDGGWVW